MRLSLSLLITSLLVTSCGGKSGSGGGGTNVIPQITTSTPIILTKEYPECPRVYAQSTNTELEIIKFFKGNTATESVDFYDLLTGSKLVDRDNIILVKTLGDAKVKTTWQMRWSSVKNEYDIDYEAENGGRERDDKEGDQFEVCKGAINFKKDSLENAALNITNTIRKTREAILTAANDLKIPPVIVRVLPLISSQDIYINGPKADSAGVEDENGDMVLEEDKKYSTDNATWSRGSFFSDDVITFYPQSEEFIKMTNIVTPFWEIPMVGAHEFGHHIFDKIFPNKSGKKQSQISSCINSKMHMENINKHVQKNVKNKTIRVSGSQYAYSSLHEAIGDLISFYSLAPGEGSLAGINCMAKSRDADSAKFGDGSVKKFTKNVVRIMNSKEYLMPTSRDCNAPYYQDNHAIGAIFAYNYEQIISNYTNDRSQKLEVLIRWGQESSKFQTELNDLSSSKYIAEVTKILYKTIYKELNITPSSKECVQIKSMYYELAEDFGSTEHMKCN